MKRACVALIVVLVAAACGSDKQFLVPAHPTGPTDPSPTTTVPTVGVASFLIQGPAPIIGPGESAQVKAIAIFSDGTQRDVAADSVWSSSQSQIATVNAGMISGQALGRTVIRATYQGRTTSLSIVIEPAGTFIVNGNVSEPGPVMVPGATVTVLNGSPNQASADAQGFYELFGIAGAVTLRVSKPGYLDETRTVTVTQNQKLDVQVRPVSAPTPVAGNYRVTLTISPSCSVVPPEQKTRTYSATISQEGALLKVQLGGANFVGQLNSFTGKIAGSTLTFNLQINDFYYGILPAVEEILDGAQILEISGSMVATAGPSITGNFVGVFTYREGKSRTTCSSSDSTMTFVGQ